MDLLSIAITESEAFKRMLYNQEQILKKLAYIEMIADNDRWLSTSEAAKYVGFKEDWVRDRSNQIGAFKDGNGGYRYKKTNLDTYMLKHSFKK